MFPRCSTHVKERIFFFFQIELRKVEDIRIMHEESSISEIETEYWQPFFVCHLRDMDEESVSTESNICHFLYQALEE